MQNKFQNCYEELPEYYDILYHRYLKTIPDFVDLVKNNTPVHGKILDLAAGTGEVSIPLIESGYLVTSFDLNSGMLKILEEKANSKKLISRTIIGDMTNIDEGIGTFDTICIRQAINYFLGEESLASGLKRIHNLLKEGGTFVFNSPNYNLDIKKYPDVENRYEENENQFFVLESNILKDRLLEHRQYTTIWGKDFQTPVQIRDANTFYMFTKNDFEKCLKIAGFNDISFYAAGMKTFDQSGKTIYGVAKK